MNDEQQNLIAFKIFSIFGVIAGSLFFPTISIHLYTDYIILKEPTEGISIVFVGIIAILISYLFSIHGAKKYKILFYDKKNINKQILFFIVFPALVGFKYGYNIYIQKTKNIPRITQEQNKNH